TELGSGFKIAMRDLSIRGAGNLLGAQQHGFIDSVGFDMYNQMLTEAIEAKKQGKEIEEVKPFNPEITLTIDAYIPDTYIKDERQKIDMYKQFQTIRSKEDIIDLQDELLDRFGDFPTEVENLFIVSELRWLAKKERVESIHEKNNKIELLVSEERSQLIDGSKISELANEYGREIMLGTEGNKLKIMYRFSKDTKVNRYDTVKDFIGKMDKINR